MSDAIGYDDLVKMLRSAAAQIRVNQDLLSKLDSFGGDGDHGTTMVRAMNNLEQTIDRCASRDIKTLLYDIGWAIMGADGGATGPLFGSFFMSMSSAADGKSSLDAPALAAAFEAGLAGIQKQSKAKGGDKTMLDALIPAVAAAKQASSTGDIAAVLRQTAEAAAAGAEATTNFQARFGRAKTLGPKSIGHPDAGATSVSLIFNGFYQGLKHG